VSVAVATSTPGYERTGPRPAARYDDAVKRRVRRIITRAIVFLLLGAIVNVAVAWACALYPWDPRARGLAAFRPFEGDDDGRGWLVNLHQRWGHSRVIAFPKMSQYNFPVDEALPAIYPSWSGWPRGLDEAGGPDLPGRLMVDAAGWPVLALIGSRTDSWPWEPASNEGWTGAVGLSPRVVTLKPGQTVTYERALPLRPVWPGFAINTALYAAILWLLFAAPFALRRCRRIKRGLCPACAYPVGTSDVCTECGAAVKSRTMSRCDSPINPLHTRS
jgi:hypothetical protein